MYRADLKSELLLRTQKIARTTDLQITHGDLEAGAEFRKVPDGGQTLFRNLRQILVGTVGEVGVGVAGGAAYTATELMKLGKSEALGVLNDHHAGVGDIDTDLNDGGGNEDVQLSVREFAHDGILFGGLELSVNHADGYIGEVL